MSFWKIYDVRAAYRDGTVYLNLKGPAYGFPVREQFSNARAAAVLQAFDMGRDLYLDKDSGDVTTIPTTVLPSETSGNGIVVTWDMRIPQNGNAVFYLGLRGEKDDGLTSGDAASSWVQMECPEEVLNAVLALVTSSYCVLRDGVLFNTSYEEFLEPK